MKNKLVMVLAVMLMSVSGGAQTHTTDTSRAVAALGEFETIFYSKANLVFNSPVDPRIQGSGIDLLRLPFIYLWEGLGQQSSDFLREVQGSSRAVVVGASDFRRPAGLGMVRSRRCYIILLKDGSSFDLKKYFREMPSAFAMGEPIRTWSAALAEFGEEDLRPSSFYATQFGHSYIVVSNDVKELQAVARKLGPKDKEAQAVDLSPDLALLTGYEYWGYRRYQLTNAIDEQAGETADIKLGTDALVFHADRVKKNAVLRFVGAPESVQHTAANINAKNVLPTFRQFELGIWESNMSLSESTPGDRNMPQSKSRQSFDFMAAVFDLFGFGVYS
ncbi:MAG TPA: hypothetical protein VEW69_04195 [Alphaproteobacteria bacterium]|nr:hypothetical protein [Alphaproteobacteria bacterium]